MKAVLSTMAGLGLALAALGAQAEVTDAMNKAGCMACHAVDKKVIGPAYNDVSLKYKGDAGAAAKLTTKVKWSTFPPSGGSHYPLWAVWGFYTQPVNPRQVVHNLEHGGVVLWWGPKVPESTVSRLRAFYNQSPTGMFGTPLAGLGNKVAVSAWTGDPAAASFRVSLPCSSHRCGRCPTSRPRSSA